MLRRSRSRKDTPEVSGGILLKKRPLIATYTSSLVIDSLCDQARKGDIAVAWLYCDYNTQQEQTAINMMGAILRRLVGREIPDDIRKAFQEGRRPLLPDLKRMLRIAIALLPQVFICIDALDECLPKDLPALLGSLSDIIRESPRTRIFLTGRPHVSEAVQSYFTKAVAIQISPYPDDIRNYVVMRLDRDDVPEAMNNDLRAEIVRIILDKMSNMCVEISTLSTMSTYKQLCRFLLVSLNMEVILGEMTIRQRRKKLKEMERGTGLSEAYTATITRLKAQKGNRAALGMKALMWALYSERPLRAEELCHALGVEIESTEPDTENVPAIRTLLESCLGLLTVEESSATVRLVHFTLQEHLSSDPTLFHSPHSTIAEVCLVYLNFGSVRNLSPTLGTPSSTMPLLEYASLYWGDHAKRGMTENAKRLALRLLDKFDEHISTKLLLSHYQKEGLYPYYSLHGPKPMGFTGLHGASALGIAEIVAALLEMKEWDVNATDSEGRTALTWAATRGHKKVVKMLLEREGINPDHVDTKYGWTPLSRAARRGHEGIVKLLLEREEVNPDYVDTIDGRTPLSWAAEGGHEGIVKMLLEREEVNPGHVDTDYGRTPLSWAAWGGRERIVKLLLEREEVNPDHVDTDYGRTPLSWAAEGGHERIVKLLLEREEVNPDHVRNYHGRTPLSWAAKGGHEGIVKLLLEREEVNPDSVGTHDGRTPLSWAAKLGHEGIVKLLLERVEVNLDHVDTKYGRTPLSWATEYGHQGVVKMLLERTEVNTNRADTQYGQPPLASAAEGGHEEVVKAPLERSDVRTAVPDYQNQTPLSLALSEGHDGVVEILREQGHPNLDSESCASQTSPHSSSQAGAECLGMQLTSNPNTDPADPYRQLALLSPGAQGHEPVLGPENLCSTSPDNNEPPATEPPNLLQPSSRQPLNLSYLVHDRYWIMAAFFCLLALLVYFLSSPLLDSFSFHK